MLWTIALSVVAACSIIMYQMFNKPKALQVGDTAPNFTLQNQDGNTISLSDFHGQKNVVLFFYPKDQTEGCTKEACRFRDRYEEITELGAEVIGINGDGTSSHKKFVEKHQLPYHLVTDEGGKTRKAYGVGTIYLILPDRVSFVIDKEGVIRHVYKGNANAEQHVDEALGALKKL